MTVAKKSARGAGRYSAEAEAMFGELDAMVSDVELSVRDWRGWRLLDTPGPSLAALIREIFRAVHMYQGRTTEAGFTMIGRLPKHEVKLIQILTHHKAEEAEHGLWAWEDYVALGGDPALKDAPATPAAFAVAAVWDRLSRVSGPYGYLGAEYLFENLTERITAQVSPRLARDGNAARGFRFIHEHAVEDARHANLFRHLIRQTLTEHPQVFPDMVECFRHFAQVYPIPVWDEAFERAFPLSAAEDGRALL